MSDSSTPIAIVDYGMGNLGSFRNILKKVGAKGAITSDPAEIARADKIILPGVGHFAKAMKNIDELGLRETLNHKAVEERTPILGVCLGMQLMTVESEEAPGTKGFGWIEARAERFDPSRFEHPLRVPHMGWNLVDINKPHRLFDDDGFDEHRYYFVHTYAVQCESDNDVLCRTKYGYSFVSGFAKNNIVGFQFHPEKSHKFGMSLLKRFAEAF